MTQIAAVVVTYNRPGQLVAVLQAVLAQSRAADRVVVVNNASDAGTTEALAPYRDDARFDITRLATNTGGAGGFAFGMERALDLGADDVWIMDDDCYPQPDALASLLDGRRIAERRLGKPVPFACSVVRWTDGSVCQMNNAVPAWDWIRLLNDGTNCILVASCSFVSVLIPSWTIQQNGLPLSEYFIWYDDVEYTRRLTGSAEAGIQVLASVVVHDLPDNLGVNFADVTAKNLWKYRYGARNMASWHFFHANKFAYLAFCREILGQMRHGKVPMALQRQIVRALVEGPTFNPRPRFPARDASGTASNDAPPVQVLPRAG